MIVLASQSPRRRRLLDAVGVEFEVRPVDIDESARAGETPTAYVERLAREKARVAVSRGDLSLSRAVLAADTIVVLDGLLLGKPEDTADAAAMLGRLSGRTHEVFTGVCVAARDREDVRVVRTAVGFRRLKEREIRAYVETGECLDKAGAYAIQGVGGALVDRVEGSYTNVIGLPLAVTLEMLEEVGDAS